MYQIPESEKVNTSSLARIFDNKSESYKLFWFKAILHEVAKGENDISFCTLIERMIVDAWYMVCEYKLNLGPADTLEKTVQYVAAKTQFLPTEKEVVILKYLKETDDKQIRDFMRILSLNVPYRLQAPLMPNPGAKVWYKISAITDYINAQPGTIYIIQHLGTLDSRIVVSTEWMDYLRANMGIILGWVDYNLIMYLQRRNPTVPGISNKIYPPQERNLTIVGQYWKYIIQKHQIPDIYSGTALNSRNVSIDHFIPWSYVASDELWNLIPTIKSVNSSKSNNLPEWDTYFKSLAHEEYSAYSLVSEDKQAERLFNKCLKDNLNNEEIRYRLYKPGQSEGYFTSQLQEIMLPVYESAKNLGFREWTYRI